MLRSQRQRTAHISYTIILHVISQCDKYFAKYFTSNHAALGAVAKDFLELAGAHLFRVRVRVRFKIKFFI